jgi:hypothetical protein
MKRTIVVIIGLGVLVGLGFYVVPRATSPNLTAESRTQAVSPPAELQAQAVEEVAPNERPALIVETPPTAKPNARPRPAVVEAKSDAAFASRAVDLLVSAQATLQQKREAWKQLRESGALDQAIAELEQRMTNEPSVAQYPATLGHAYLQKCGTLQDVREQGILGMQADKLFDSALTLDSSNWEARFMKAVGMSYWPPVLNKGEEVIQHFEILIQQQEGQTPQPYFAEPYSWLGDQYQKAGRTNEARAVWERGKALFPADEKLAGKLAGVQ